LATKLEHHHLDVAGLRIHYVTAGEGPPVVLLHGAGDSAFDWSWVMPALAGHHHVYAPDLPGFGDSAKPRVEYSSTFLAGFLGAFMEALGIQRASVVGNSVGGVAALRLTLSQPEKVAFLSLVDSGGLGKAVSPGILPILLPGLGEVGIAWARTPLGAAQRAWWRAGLLFSRPARAPVKWIAEQRRLARLPGFLEATLSALRAGIDLAGQREVLLNELPRVAVPTLVVWGALDGVFPKRQAGAAVERLPKGRLAVIPACGHLPHVEAPEQFLSALLPALGEHSDVGLATAGR
jgi:2-hydroxy-6-oxonona-2,4-dienedioate hydrolase